MAFCVLSVCPLSARNGRRYVIVSKRCLFFQSAQFAQAPEKLQKYYRSLQIMTQATPVRKPKLHLSLYKHALDSSPNGVNQNDT